jgi:ATP-dependent Lhr-like helicase
MTTTSPPSSSNYEDNSTAFGRLHPSIQRWIWDKNWSDLKPVQEHAAGPILAATNDVIITAPTAGGKTEAAFLPILTHVMEHPGEGVRVLYISPLRALINDQFDRLEDLGCRLGIQFHRWHGDVASSAKKRVLDNPNGVLLMTPESLEAQFVLRGSLVPQLLSGLTYIVIDEFHAFIGTERGTQLRSLLHRVELAIKRRVPRIALSATLREMPVAAEALRPEGAASVEIIHDASEAQGLRLKLRAVVEVDPIVVAGTEGQNSGEQVDASSSADETIADILFCQLRGQKNLVFANARGTVEKFADLLRYRCEAARVPQEFWPHHGNLSRDLREDVERMLKETDRPITGICTSTLELGIDIGSVESVAQIGVPPSVASLRQRLGRSGRKAGQDAILRLFIKERATEKDMSLEDELHLDLVQTMAVLSLLLKKWCEPPVAKALHLSTLVHQVLALVAQHGGIIAGQAWTILCGEGGAFSIEPKIFVQLLRAMGEKDLIIQSDDGTLLPGRAGERIVNHYSFYSVFMTPQEYRLVSDGRTLGSLPIAFPVSEGQFLIFGGKRWSVIEVDDQSHTIRLASSRGGKVPLFGGAGFGVHDEVRREMRRIYVSEKIPTYLDETALQLLQNARRAFADMHLDSTSIVQRGRSTSMVVWAGDRALNTVQLLLASSGIQSQRSGPILSVVGADPEEMRKCQLAASSDCVDLVRLSSFSKNRILHKYDELLPDELLCIDYASRELSRLLPEYLENDVRRTIQ